MTSARRAAPTFALTLGLALAALAPSGAAAAHELTPTSAAWASDLAVLAGAKEPTAAIAALWELAELAPIVLPTATTLGTDVLAAELARLRDSRLAFLPGEARLVAARLAVTAPDAAVRVATLAREAGVLGDGRVFGPAPGPDSSDAPPALDAKGWRDFAGLARPGSLPLGDFLATPGDSHLFVAFTVTAKKAAKPLLVVGSNGPLEVWVDGRSTLTFDGERSFSDWQHAVPVDLPAGQHSIVARVGHRTAAPQLSLRLVDARGLLPAALGGPPGDTPATRGLLALAGDDLGRGLLRVWVTPTQHIDDAAADAALSARRPDLAARLHPDDESAMRSLLEAGSTVTSLAALLDLSTREGLAADADRLARAIAAVEPDHPAVLVHRALALLDAADPTGALGALGDDRRAGVNARLAATRATLLERAGRIPDAARAWATVARILDADSDPASRAVTLFRRAGDDAGAAALLRELIARRPYLLDLRILLARALSATAPADGLAALDEVATFHADRAELHETRGRILLLGGERGPAVAAFDRALELKPQARDLADYRRALVAERGLADDNAVPLASVLATSRSVPLASQGAVALLERQVVRVFPSGLSSTFRQIVYRIDTDAAAQGFQSFDLAFTPGEDRVEVLEAEIIRGGQKLRPESIQEVSQDGKNSGVYTLQAAKVVRFPALQKGDVMHLQLRTDEIGSRNLFGDFFGVIVPMSGDLPKRKAELVIEAPATRPLFWHVQGLGEPRVESLPAAGDAPARQRLTFTAEPLPAMIFEPDRPGYGDIASWVSVSTFERWEDLGRWYRQLVRAQLEVPPDLAALAQKLAAGASDLRGKVEAIHGWVIANTRYVGIEFGIHGYKPYAVSEIVKRGYGDCKDKASLIVALCHAAGIPAEFVLVRTRDLGSLEGTPATFRAFNHAIAYIPGLDLYLDGTAELSGLEELPSDDQGAQVLRLDLYGDGPPVVTRIPMQTAAMNGVTATSRFELAPTGDATATFTETIRGTEAARLRSLLADPTRRDQALGAVIAAQHPGATLTSATYDNLDRPGRPVVIRAAAHLPTLGVRRDSRMEVPIVLEPGQRLQEEAPMATRHHELVLKKLESEVDDDVFVAPPGWKLAETPTPVALRTPFGSYEQTVTVDAASREIRVQQRFERAVYRIAPADYPAYRAFLADIARAESTRLTLTSAH